MNLKALVASLTATVLAAAPALAVTVPPCASTTCAVRAVPEVSSNGSVAALVVVAALAMLIWERRRRHGRAVSNS